MEEPWKWHRHHLGLVFQKHLSTRVVRFLLIQQGFCNSRHVKGGTNFQDTVNVLWISNTFIGFLGGNGISVPLATSNESGQCLALRCFQKTQRWWLHLCPALNSNMPVFRLNYNQLFNRKWLHFSAKKTTLLFLFQTRCNYISSMTEVVAYWKRESSKCQTPKQIYIKDNWTHFLHKH